MKVYRVTSVVVIRAESRLIVQVSGLAATPGWTNPILAADDPNPADRVFEFAFDATPPGAITLQILTPISASIVIDSSGVDGIIVKARTNSIEVHASEFQSVGSPFPTLPIGEGPLPTSTPIGEEGPLPTTRPLGEEGPFPTSRPLGEEDPPASTHRFGEEDLSRLLGEANTLRFGEGPLGTGVQLDDPAAILLGGGLTTLAMGEEGGPVDPRMFGQSTPFGGF